MNCQDCVYSKMAAPGQLRCQRFPPVPLLVGMTDNGPAIMGVFPAVQPLMSCGEYKPDLMVQPKPQTELIR